MLKFKDMVSQKGEKEEQLNENRDTAANDALKEFLQREFGLALRSDDPVYDSILREILDEGPQAMQETARFVVVGHSFEKIFDEEISITAMFETDRRGKIKIFIDFDLGMDPIRTVSNYNYEMNFETLRIR